MGGHRLICGDSTSPDDTSQLLTGVSPHLMVTDPPYGVSYDPAWRKRAGVNLNPRKLGKVVNDDQDDWREAWALFPGSVGYIWHASLHTSEVKQSLEASGFVMRAQIIWAKDRFAFSRGHYHWQHEPCWYAVRGTSGAHWSGDRKQSTVWTIPARDDDGHGHGTQKPVECMRRPIENNSSPGQAIYDPFCGSGTTIIAAEMTGRSCFAIEIDPAYVDVAVLRWQALQARPRCSMAPRDRYEPRSGAAGRERRLVGRRAHRPDPAQRRQVEALAAYGIPEADISGVVGIDPKTLRKYYRDELDLGETKANAQVAGFLFNAAKNGNVTAQIFWLKTRAKWRETPVEHKHSGSIGRRDLSEISDEELLDMITTLSAEVGLAPIKTIDMEQKSSSVESPEGNVLRLMPKN